jgi:hypothetical protein
MTVNQANLVNAKTSTFEYVQVNVDLSAMNDDAFALAA